MRDQDDNNNVCLHNIMPQCGHLDHHTMIQNNVNRGVNRLAVGMCNEEKEL